MPRSINVLASTSELFKTSWIYSENSGANASPNATAFAQ